MARKRKYPKTSGYFVYAHVTPDELYYVGMTKQQPCERWKPSKYKDKSLSPYINKYGWENIKHTIIKDGLTKERAEHIEDWFIKSLSINGLCINKQRSGGRARDDKKAYMKQYYEEHQDDIKQYLKEHKEERKAYDKQRLSTPEGKIYNRVTSYNRYHTPIETPAEAKQKYIEFGTIPSYIKNDDLK